jgi:hypothetical protein
MEPLEIGHFSRDPIRQRLFSEHRINLLQVLRAHLLVLPPPKLTTSHAIADGRKFLFGKIESKPNATGHRKIGIGMIASCQRKQAKAGFKPTFEVR